MATEAMDRRQEGYERDEGYDGRGGYQGREEGYDRRVILMVMMPTASKAIVAAMKVTIAGTKATATGVWPSREGDYGPYYERPYGWQERDCLQFGQEWYCRQ
jgi:hypothetical protein